MMVKTRPFCFNICCRWDVLVGDDEGNDVGIDDNVALFDGDDDCTEEEGDTDEHASPKLDDVSLALKSPPSFKIVPSYNIWYNQNHNHNRFHHHMSQKS